MSKYERSIALLLHDGLKFTPKPLTDLQYGDLMLALRMIAVGQASDLFERDLFRSMLSHKWITTAPFNQEVIK